MQKQYFNITFGYRSKNREFALQIGNGVIYTENNSQQLLECKQEENKFSRYF
jgi:hypothetical protein